MTDLPKETLAGRMALLADVFVFDARQAGHDFTYRPEDGPAIDAYVDEVLASGASERVKHELIVATGAYVGEVLVRAGLAHWSEEDLSEPTLVLTTGLVGKPLEKVAKRVHIGPMHSLAQYVDFVTSGADASTFPGAQVHDLSGRGEA